MSIINPISSKYHAIEDFKSISIENNRLATNLLKGAILVLSILAAIPTFGLGGVAVFRTLVNRCKVIVRKDLPENSPIAIIANTAQNSLSQEKQKLNTRTKKLEKRELKLKKDIEKLNQARGKLVQEKAKIKKIKDEELVLRKQQLKQNQAEAKGISTDKREPDEPKQEKDFSMSVQERKEYDENHKREMELIQNKFDDLKKSTQDNKQIEENHKREIAQLQDEIAALKKSNSRYMELDRKLKEDTEKLNLARSELAQKETQSQEIIDDVTANAEELDRREQQLKQREARNLAEEKRMSDERRTLEENHKHVLANMQEEIEFQRQMIAAYDSYFREKLHSKNKNSMPISEDDNSNNSEDVLIELENENEIIHADFPLSKKNWVSVNSHSTVISTNCLTTFKAIEGGPIHIKLHPALTKENWDDLLDANDLSYQVAKMHTASNQAKVTQRFNIIENKLHQNGWKDFKILFGATGANNIDQDASCIIMTNHQRKLIYVAFHGSRNGSYFPYMGNGGGDWGANYQSDLVDAQKIGLRGAPEGVCVHEGFGKNFVSVQDTLLERLEQSIKTFNNNDEVQIMITGHSKGGAEANLAAPVVKAFLSSQNYGNVSLGIVTLSAPRAFNSAGAKWVHDTVHRSNILRVKVQSDLVTYMPLTRYGYEHVGVLILEDIKYVNERTKKHKNTDALGKIEGYANYHYGAEREGSYCFVPEIVIPFDRLLEGIYKGIDDRKVKDIDPYPKEMIITSSD